MKTENWHKISSPLVESHFPCWLCAIETKQVHFWRTLHEMKGHEPLWSCYTHWMEATPDTLPQPPKEPTREELDNVLINLIEETYAKDNSLYGHGVLIALAIKFERSEIRHLIDRHKSGELPGPEVIRQITERVKL